MAARSVPALPTWTAGQRVLASQLQQITTWGSFWANKPMFRMYQTVVQSVPNTTFTQITCDTSEDDTDSGRGGSTPWSYTIPSGMGGVWLFSYKTAWSSNATGTRAAALYINGVQATATNAFEQGLSGVSTFVVGLPRRFLVSAGDVIALYGRQTSGGALNTGVGSSPDYSYFEGSLESLASP